MSLEEVKKHAFEQTELFLKGELDEKELVRRLKFYAKRYRDEGGV